MNRHVKTAFFIAPFLFLAGFLATEYFMNRQEAAQTQNQALKAQPGCDLANAPCVMAYDAFSVTIQASQAEPSVLTIGVNSNQLLQSVVIELLAGDGSSTGARTMQTPGDHKHWLVDLPGMTIDQPDHIRIAISTPTRQYYGTTAIRP